ncbi:hypothetical protein OG524_13530 [Streptomyces sp. NBC_01520]|uniref:hypothetical protein n=1 Tax=Streptomyces sp. NBC_01520 TaxID=2903892 RepID=UPI003868A722
MAGADVFPLDEPGRITLAARGGERTVTTDDRAGMFPAVKGDAIIPKDGDDARIAPPATGTGPLPDARPASP